MKMNDIRIGTYGGTICSIWASFSFGNLLQTIVMAIVGTLVSYVTSKLMARIFSKRLKKTKYMEEGP